MVADGVKQEMQTERPALTKAVQQLKGSPLWKEPPLISTPSSPLPPFPEHTGSARQPEYLSSQRQPNNPSSTQPTLRPTISRHEAIPMAQNLRPGLTPTPEAGQDWPSHPNCGIQVGQYAQMLQYGQPIGVVQMTHQGWAGPPHLLNIFSQQQQHNANLYAQQSSISSFSSHCLQASKASRGNPASWQHVIREPALCSTQLGRHSSDRLIKRQKLNSAHEAPVVQDQASHWRAEDIDLADSEDDSDSACISQESIPGPATKIQGIHKPNYPGNCAKHKNGKSQESLSTATDATVGLEIGNKTGSNCMFDMEDAASREIACSGKPGNEGPDKCCPDYLQVERALQSLKDLATCPGFANKCQIVV